MLDPVKTWLSGDPADHDDDSGWGLSLWWGAVVVVLFTVAISLCNSPGQNDLIAGTTTPPGVSVPSTTVAAVGTPNLLDVIDAHADLTFFRSLIAAGGIDANVADGGPFTFFAPNDAAFAELPGDVRAGLLADPVAAVNLLGAHVAIGQVPIADLVAAGVVETGSGETLPVTSQDGDVFVGEVRVVEPDLIAANGIVHIVDSIRPITPANPPDGGALPVSQIIAGRAELSTLVTALGAADGATLLEADEAGFTVFAPTNDAFAALPVGAVDVLIATQPKLLELLGYHVVGGRLLAADLVDGQVLTTASGAELPVAVDGAIVTVGGVTITEADLVGTNGVVHIVGDVLLPPDFTLPTINEAIGLEPITFEISSSTITAQGVEVLQGAVDFLIANPDVRIAIEGHTDSQGSEGANQALSEARATSVRDYLVSQGIEADRLEAAGFGESNPIADNGTADGRAENRRIEFRLL